MILLDPENRVEFWLDIDADKPPESRPTFIARPISARGWANCNELIRGAPEQPGQDGLDRLLAAIQLLVVGWRNVSDEPFSVERLANIATFDELWAIFFKAIEATRPSEDERKKSDSRSPSNSASSATTAPA